MNEPRRLREDPELRQAFEDERLALGPHDLAALRARVVAGSPVPAPPSGPRWPTLVGISGLTAALVSVALWAILPSGPVIPPPQSTPAPPVEDGSRNRLWAIIGLLALGLVVAALFLAFKN